MGRASKILLYRSTTEYLAFLAYFCLYIKISHKCLVFHVFTSLLSNGLHPCYRFKGVPTLSRYIEIRTGPERPCVVS